MILFLEGANPNTMRVLPASNDANFSGQSYIMQTTNEYWADKKHPENLLDENNHVVCLRTMGSPKKGVAPYKIVFYYNWAAGQWQFDPSVSAVPTTNNMEVYNLSSSPLEATNLNTTYNQSSAAQTALLNSIANELQRTLPTVTFYLPEAADGPSESADCHVEQWIEHLYAVFEFADLAEDGYAGTAPAESFPPNNYGVFNMAGNVWEWCADYFDTLTRATGTRVNPVGPRGGTAKVMKGGSYLCHASYCFRYRNSARTSNTPDSSAGNLGFRVERDVLGVVGGCTK